MAAQRNPLLEVSETKLTRYLRVPLDLELPHRLGDAFYLASTILESGDPNFRGRMLKSPASEEISEDWGDHITADWFEELTKLKSEMHEAYNSNDFVRGDEILIKIVKRDVRYVSAQIVSVRCSFARLKIIDARYRKPIQRGRSAEEMDDDATAAKAKKRNSDLHTKFLKDFGKAVCFAGRQGRNDHVSFTDFKKEYTCAKADIEVALNRLASNEDPKQIQKDLHFTDEVMKMLTSQKPAKSRAIRQLLETAFGIQDIKPYLKAIR